MTATSATISGGVPDVTAVFGLLLALACLAVVGACFALAIVAATVWQSGDRILTAVLICAGLLVGATSLTTAALHQIGQVLP